MNNSILGWNEPKWKKILLCTWALSFLIFIFTALNIQGFDHPDEYFQIVEFVSHKVGITQASEMSWEFQKKVRPWLQPLLGTFLYKATTPVHQGNPISFLTLFRITHSFFAWSATFLLSLFAFSLAKRDIFRGKMFLFALFFSCFVPSIHSRTSSENFSSIFLILSVCLFYFSLTLQNNQKNIFPIFALIGICFGLAFQARYQTAIFFVGFCLGLFAKDGKKAWSSNIVILFSFSIVTLFGILIDYWGYGVLQVTAIRYFDVNLIQGKAAEFGRSHFLNYFVLLSHDTFGKFFSLIALIIIFLTSFRSLKDPIKLGVLFFIAGHFLISHKEARFLYPVLVFIPLYMNDFIDMCVQYKLQNNQIVKNIGILLIVTNFFFLVRNCLYNRLLPEADAIKTAWDEAEKNTGTTILFSPEKDLFRQAHLDMHFLRHPSLQVVEYSNDSDIDRVLDHFPPYFKNNHKILWIKKDQRLFNGFGLLFPSRFTTLPLEQRSIIGQ